MKRLLIIFATGIAVAAVALAQSRMHQRIAELNAKAEEGDAEALFRLAILYDNGFDSIAPDSIRSTEILREAALKGYAPAMNFLGYRLISGEVAGIERDEEQGLDWLEKAADAGDVKAASNIGWLYMEGKYLPQDYEKAAGWFKMAADKGLPVAQSLLGDLYRDGLGVERSAVKADSLYREAFEAGLVDAGYKLADLNADYYSALSPEEKVSEGKYYYFRGAPSQGVRLFYLAADEGDPQALALLGDAYTRAVGVPYDYELSLKYYVRAALAGNPSAQFILGELLEIFPDALRSLGDAEYMKQPYSDPLYWFERAAEGGVTDADQAARLLE